ncbi:MAG: glycerol-3-phosphate 1-O-acyltransferase PlsY [Oscillospiraceae bacterium]|jgi:glycerol-3-phosphate acyltransferase PlsY|nr:glycerol-3-phosphate 1-O-acyltransferase PlsY [Oscillospiraceae bacterium]
MFAGLAAIGWIVVAAASYLVGGLSTGLWVSSRLKGLDVRKFGSGSSGATNVLRTLGRGPGLVVFAGDMLKGALTALAGLLLGGPWCAFICGLLAVAGNIWPITAQFKGGKGVSTAAGVFLAVAPWQAVLAIALAFAVIYLSKLVSMGSLAGLVGYWLIAGVPGLFSSRAYLFWLSLGINAMVFYAHRQNIRRLLDGKENKLDMNILSGRKKI